VIKTVFIDVTFNVLLGLALPIAAGEKARGGAPFFLRYLAIVVLFELFFFMPGGYWLYRTFPDWSLMYAFDPAALTWLTPPLVALFYLAAAVTGFSASFAAVRWGRGGVAYALVAVVVAALGAIFVWGLKRLVVVGTFSEFNAGTGMTSILGSPLSWQLAIIVAWVVLPLAVIFWRTRRA
jgi:hypothetical protein